MKNQMTKAIERFRGWSNAQRGLVIVLGMALCLEVLAPARRVAPLSRAPMQQTPLAELAENEASANPAPMAGRLLTDKDLKELQAEAAVTRESLKTDLAERVGAPFANGNPLIAHTAELAVVTKEFARSRN